MRHQTCNHSASTAAESTQIPLTVIVALIASSNKGRLANDIQVEDPEGLIDGGSIDPQSIWQHGEV